MSAAAPRLNAVTLIAFLATVSLFAQQQQKQSKDSATGWIGQQIWAEASTDDSGRVSADGRFLTFANYSTGEMSLRDLVSRTNRALIRSPGAGLISPDGTHVALVSSTNSLVEVNILPVAGGTPRKIALPQGARTISVNDWTADARALLVMLSFNDAADATQLGFLDIESGRFSRVSSVERISGPRVSPDGSKIVLSYFAMPKQTERDVAIIDVATGQMRPLLTGPADDHAADWAPDSQTIYFLSDRDQKAQLWRVRAAATNPRPERLHEVPDGDDYLLGVTDDGRVFIGAEDVGGTNSYVANMDWRTGEVSAIRQVAHPPLRGSRRTVLSRDGEQVAFLRRARGLGIHPGWQIPVVQSFDGKRERVYDTTLTIRDEPVWSPDGRALFIAAPPEGTVGNAGGARWRFLRLDLESGVYAEVADPGRTDVQLRLAGLIGDELFYMQHDFVTSIGSVVGVNLKTKARRTLYTHTAAITDAAVSADARQLAFTSRVPDGGGSTAVYLITPSPNAASPKLLATLRGEGTTVQVAWSADGQSVLSNGSLDGIKGLCRIPTNGDPPQLLKLDFPDLTEVRASADGRRIAFTRRAQSFREVWEYRPK